jgi:spermidine synthase
LWLIPTFGTKGTLYILAFILIVIGSFGLRRRHQALVVILTVGIAFFISSVPLQKKVGILYEKDTLYSYVRVIEDTAGTRYMQFNQGKGIQSVYNPEKILTGYYFDDMAVLGGHGSGERRVLMIGLAGGTTGRIMINAFPGSVSIDAVEIDPEVTTLSKASFGLRDLPIRFITDDGRTYIHTTQEKYNYILVDAYHNESVIPWTITTTEFWDEVKRHLTTDGVVAMNIYDPGNQMLYKAIANSEASVFPYTYISSNGVYNYLIISSLEPLDLPELAQRLKEEKNILAPTAASLADQIETFIFDPNTQVLTDDNAPVEFLSYGK